MTALEIAKIGTGNTLNTYIDNNSTVFAGNDAFAEEVTRLKTSLKGANELATLLAVDNTVYSTQKLQAKNNMANLAADLCGFAQVCLNKIGKTKEASQLHISVTDYSIGTDTESKTMAQTAHDLLANVIGDISPKYVTVQDLTDLQGLIDTFSNIQGASSVVQIGTPEQRKNFKNVVFEMMLAIADLKLMARKYKNTNPEFYKQFIALSTVPKVHVHHTTVSVIVKSKTDNSAINNATGSLDNSNKTGVSDVSGLMFIEQVRNGNAMLTIKASGYTDYSALVNLVGGQENHFDVFM